MGRREDFFIFPGELPARAHGRARSHVTFTQSHEGRREVKHCEEKKNDGGKSFHKFHELHGSATQMRAPGSKGLP
jgi:hypothetical protein